MRQWILPILEAGGIDLILNGHSHTYERTMLIDGCYDTNQVSENFVLDDGDGDPDGTGPYRKSAGIHPHEGSVVCVTGHGGMTIGRTGTLPLAAQVFTEHGSTVVDIDGDTLTASMVNYKGEVKDRWQIVKRGQVKPVRLALPWQPREWKPEEKKEEKKDEKKDQKKEDKKDEKKDQKKDEQKPAQPEVKEEDKKKWPDAMADIPLHHRVIVPPNAEWQFLAGSDPRGSDWKWPEFDAAKWQIGRAAFGYKYTTNVLTHLDTLRNNYSVVYTRREFTIDRPDRITELGLMIDFDDGFIAYVNGHEVARKGVGRGSGPRAQKREPHDAIGYLYFPLNDAVKWLRRGLNVIAIEGHNHTVESSDFFLDPYVIAEE